MDEHDKRKEIQMVVVVGGLLANKQRWPRLLEGMVWHVRVVHRCRQDGVFAHAHCRP